jgi:DNA invertase Pin-like site-specific DNA recombinase
MHYSIIYRGFLYSENEFISGIRVDGDHRPAKSDRPQLVRPVKALEPVDVLIVTRLDRLARQQLGNSWTAAGRQSVSKTDAARLQAYCSSTQPHVQRHPS